MSRASGMPVTYCLFDLMLLDSERGLTRHGPLLNSFSFRPLWPLHQERPLGFPFSVSSSDISSVHLVVLRGLASPLSSSHLRFLDEPVSENREIYSDLLDWKRNLLAGYQKAASTKGNTQQAGLIILGARAFPRWQEFTGSLWGIAVRVIQALTFLILRVPLYEVQVPRREALVGPCGRVRFYAPPPQLPATQRRKNSTTSLSADLVWLSNF